MYEVRAVCCRLSGPIDPAKARQIPSAIPPPHRTAQVVWAVSSVLEGRIDQKLKSVRSPFDSVPRHYRNSDIRLKQVVDDSTWKIGISTLVLSTIVNAHPILLIRIEFLLFSVVGGSEEQASCGRQVDHDDPRSMVNRAIVHAGVNLPVNMLPVLCLGSHQHDSDGSLAKVPVPDPPANCFVRKVFQYVPCIDRSINERAEMASRRNQFFFVVLIIVVVIIDEHVVY